MDKKGWTRILIVIVGGLWAYNIYRTVENYQVKSDSIEERENRPLSIVPMLFNKDTFNLELPNQDPFLRGQKQWQNSCQANNGTNQTQSSSPNNRPPVQPETNVETLKWPSIKYFGFLRRIEEDHQLCMLNLNGRNYNLSVGEKKENIQIIHAYPDSVVILFNAQKKTFLK